MRIVVVGAGLSGLSAASVLRQRGHAVEVFETAEEPGGHCRDVLLEEYATTTSPGIHYHQHGPHIFHTNHPEALCFLARFTNFRYYYHRVLAETALGRVPVPFNRISKRIIRDIIEQEPTASMIRELVFAEYSRRMWGEPLEKLPAEIVERVPGFVDTDECGYFSDLIQGLPDGGYARMFDAMADGLDIHYACEPEDWRTSGEAADLVIYTGCLDEYYHRRFGALRYRVVQVERSDRCPRLPAASINNCVLTGFHTRTTDHGYWNNYNGDETVHSREYPYDAESRPDLRPAYPVPFGPHLQALAKYRELADAETRTLFCGRLGTYRYLNMDVAVLEALQLAEMVDC